MTDLMYKRGKRGLHLSTYRLVQLNRSEQSVQNIIVKLTSE